MSLSTSDRINFDYVGHIPFDSTHSTKDWGMRKNLDGFVSKIYYHGFDLLKYKTISYGPLYSCNYIFQHEDHKGYYTKCRKIYLEYIFDDIPYESIIVQYYLSYTIDNGDNESDKFDYEYDSNGLNYVFLKLYSFSTSLIETNNCFLIDCHPDKYKKKEL
ncbi:hypothetical protein ALC152_03910 [Arcobacter sp. 15-2]|uniref:hypothetical protein n=1 Tax=Arcobacter sp. 15-2 TaxID=3374109 RepID=UPI00399D3236